MPNSTDHKKKSLLKGPLYGLFLSLCGTLFIGVGYVELLFGLSGGVGYPSEDGCP
jgi:hypothetical protein